MEDNSDDEDVLMENSPLVQHLRSFGDDTVPTDNVTLSSNIVTTEARCENDGHKMIDYSSEQQLWNWSLCKWAFEECSKRRLLEATDMLMLESQILDTDLVPAKAVSRYWSPHLLFTGVSLLLMCIAMSAMTSSIVNAAMTILLTTWLFFLFPGLRRKWLRFRLKLRIRRRLAVMQELDAGMRRCLRVLKEREMTAKTYQLLFPAAFNADESSMPFQRISSKVKREIRDVCRQLFHHLRQETLSVAALIRDTDSHCVHLFAESELPLELESCLGERDTDGSGKLKLDDLKALWQLVFLQRSEYLRCCLQATLIGQSQLNNHSKLFLSNSELIDTTLRRFANAEDTLRLAGKRTLKRFETERQREDSGLFDSKLIHSRTAERQLTLHLECAVEMNNKLVEQKTSRTDPSTSLSLLNTALKQALICCDELRSLADSEQHGHSRRLTDMQIDGKPEENDDGHHIDTPVVSSQLLNDFTMPTEDLVLEGVAVSDDENSESDSDFDSPGRQEKLRQAYVSGELLSELKTVLVDRSTVMQEREQRALAAYRGVHPQLLQPQTDEQPAEIFCKGQRTVIEQPDSTLISCIESHQPIRDDLKAQLANQLRAMNRSVGHEMTIGDDDDSDD